VAFAPHPLVIVASADHPLARHASVAVEDLAGETLIVRESGSGTRSAMEEFFQRAFDQAADRHGNGQQRGDQAGGRRRAWHQLHFASTPWGWN
jgi:DNA-binding transcriptional LysR family regulator